MNQILAMAGKDIKLLVRDRMGFFFSFIFPLIYATFFGTVFSDNGGEKSGLPIAFVDMDQTASSKAFADTLKAGGEFELTGMTRDEGMDAVRRGKKVAAIVLTKGFGESRDKLFTGSGPPEIEIAFDPARKAEGAMIEGILTKYMAQSMQSKFTDPGLMRNEIATGMAALDTADMAQENKRVLRGFFTQLDTLMATEAATTDTSRKGFSGFTPVVIRKSEIVKERTGPRSSFEFSFPQGILWGILSTSLGFALSLVIERRRGTLVRLRSAPLSRGRILAGKAVACFATILTVTVVLLLIAVLVFGVRPDSVPLLVFAVLSAAIGFVGIMMVISVLGKTEASVSGLGWAFMMIMAMTGGGMIPLFVLPAWVQTIGNVSPVKWGILAIEGAIWRGFSPAEMMLPCGILLTVGILGFAIGARAFRWTES